MGERGADSTRSDSIIDAILDKVADQPDATKTASGIYRAQALAHLDVAEEIDSRLPLVPRRNWLLLVGAACVVVAFALWAAVAPSTTTVGGIALTVGGSGVVPIAPDRDGTIEALLVRRGDDVPAGAPIAAVTTADGRRFEVTAPAAGHVWQVLTQPGAIADRGVPLVSMLPVDSAENLLIAVPVADSQSVHPGQVVLIDGQRVGEVADVSSPLPASAAGPRIGATLPLGDVRLVHARLDTPLEPGSSSDPEVVVSAGTVLSRLLGR